ncbi:MAG: hypothetical protein IPM16_03960 [Chloroflexi bacterium]|nr:hypothetical protein [Chloroflexota bacterium]
MRQSVRASVMVIVFAIVLTVLVILGIQNDWGVFRRPTQEQFENLEAKNDAAFEEGAAGFASVDLSIAIIPPSSSDETRRTTFQLDRMVYYIRDDSEEIDVLEACIDDVRLIFVTKDAPQPVDGGYFFSEPVCVSPTEDDFIAESIEYAGSFSIDNHYNIIPPIDQPFRIDLSNASTISLNFWYPYDSFNLDTVIQVSYSVRYSDGTEEHDAIEPFVLWSIQTSGTRLWDLNLFAEREVEFGGDLREGYLYHPYGVFDTIAIEFQRPLLYRLAFPFFMIAMVLLISLVPLLGERDTLVDISAAMLFGIFGLKGVLGPGEQMGQTLLDIALICLYVLLVFAALLFFASRINMRWRRVSTKPEA